MGTDAAGRRQYRYHDLWREQRDRAKHDRVLGFGAALPGLREVVDRHLEGRGLTRDRVLAAAVRLVDLGFFRPDGEEYAEENGTFDLATIRKEHVHLTRGQLLFEYTAKSARHREQAIAADRVCTVVRGLKRRRSGDQLLVFRSGPRWHDVTAADINDYIRELSGGDYTAKDFRTWHATVLAAVGLAVWCGKWPATWAIPRRWRVPPTLTRASSGTTRTGAPSPAVLGDLGRDSEFGDLATRGRAESAVLKLLTVPAQPKLRQPVRPHDPAVRPLRRPIVGARGGRADRPEQRGARPGDERVRRDEQGRAEPRQDPRAYRDGSASPG
jgi:hypothetical protein